MVDRTEPGLSIVVPVHNEEACIAELGRRLTAVAEGLPETSEFILVDDGSTDGSPALIRESRRTGRAFSLHPVVQELRSSGPH